MDHPLGAVEAPQLLLLSAPFNACRAPPPQRCSRELQRPPRRVLKPEPRVPRSWVREPAAHPVAAAGWATGAPCGPLPSGVGEIQAQRPAGGHQRLVRRPLAGVPRDDGKKPEGEAPSSSLSSSVSISTSASAPPSPASPMVLHSHWSHASPPGAGGSVRRRGRPRRCVSGRAVEWGYGAPRVRAGWPGCGWEWSAAAFAPPVEAAVQARRTMRLECGLV